MQCTPISIKSPTKRVISNKCFICDRKKYYCVNSKKINIFDKLCFISKHDTINLCESAGICRPCCEKVEITFAFINKIDEKLNHVTSESVNKSNWKRKRIIFSPCLPKNVKRRRLAHANGSRRCLNFEQSPESTVDILNAESSSDVDDSKSSDHSYCVIPKETFRCTTNCDPEREMQKCIDAFEVIPSSQVQEYVTSIFENEILLKAVQQRLLHDIDEAIASLSSTDEKRKSILSRQRSVEQLLQNGNNLLYEIINEVAERAPFLMEILTIMSTNGKETSEKKVAPIAAAYAILMKSRNHTMSAWHRMTTFVAIKGHLDDSGLQRFSRMGLSLSPTSKLRLLDEAGDFMTKGISRNLLQNPIVKVTGDNLDIYIRTGHQTTERRDKDLHMFASNIIFSRITKPEDFCTAFHPTPLAKITPEMFLPQEHHKATILNSCSVILGRLLMEFDAFHWLKPVVSRHIHHPYQKEMAQKSSVFQLPIMMKNESKHEDCVDILDSYEEILSEIFIEAFGSDELLTKFKVPIGGDQLTRVRLEEAKNLRLLATTPQKRIEDLHPFIIELWHIKQDFVEKCYKETFTPSTLRQPGTLYFFKARLQRNDITGKVKGSFKSHHDFLLLVGKELIAEQFMEYFGMDSKHSQPTKNVPFTSKLRSERESQMHDMLSKFILHYGYLRDVNTTKEATAPDQNDSVYNYASNVCHWVLQLLLLEDMVKEGDVVRLVPVMMSLHPYFFSHSRLSKYFQECLDFILKTEYTLSPLQRMRVLEGAFTNLRGGQGNNIESDLVQENSVCNQKDLIRALGANKTDKAILRSTRAADTVELICGHIDSSIQVSKSSSRHNVPRAEKDEEIIRLSLRELRPFHKVQGRLCQGLTNITRSPLLKINVDDFMGRIRQVTTRLYYGQTLVSEDSDDDYDNE